jgi:hypothetical protein
MYLCIYLSIGGKALSAGAMLRRFGIYLSIHLSILLSMYLSIYLFISVCLSIYLIYPIIYLSIGEKALKEDIQLLLKEWSNYIDICHKIVISAPKTMKNIIYEGAYVSIYLSYLIIIYVSIYLFIYVSMYL